MARSIKKTGLQHPISVYMDNKGIFVLKTGQRRVLASLIAGNKTIVARVHNGKNSDYDIEVTQWIENFHREGLNIRDSVNAVKQIARIWKEKEGRNITVTELSGALFCSKGQASKYSALIDAPSDIKNAIENGGLNSLRKAYELTRIKRKTERQVLLKRVLDGSISQEKLSKIAALSVSKKIHLQQQCDGSEKISLGSVSKPEIVHDIIDMILHSEKYGELKNEFNISDAGSKPSIGVFFKKLLTRMEGI